MAEDKRYRVVLGLSIVDEGTPGFNDNGIVYHDMPYELMVQVQSEVAQQMDNVLGGMKPLIARLIELGFQRANELKGQPQKRPG